MALSTQHPRPDARPHTLTVPVHIRDLKLEIPTEEMPEHGVGPDVAYEAVSAELLLDGQARLNLATFVTTWMPSIAGRLMAETADKNMIDKDEYPQTAEIEARCVRIISGLWCCPDEHHATGCSTTGSSEAAMLAGMALKWRWRDRMRAAGKPTDRPNMVMGANVQVCWEKFCRYWDVEPRLVPMEGERYHLGAEEAVAQCDENTIGVVAILGSTFDGSYEPVADIAKALDALESDKGLDVPLHVDAASGGFVAPFIQPDLEWDFRIPRVQSINASGHKYGLVYPGVGWALWRDPSALPKDLVFDVNYLGGHMPTFALNFSQARQRGRRAVLHVRQPRIRGLPAGHPGDAGRSHLPGGSDRRDRSLPPDHRRKRPAGVRVHGQRRRHQLLGVRRVRSPPRRTVGWCPHTRSRRTARISAFCGS